MKRKKHLMDIIARYVLIFAVLCVLYICYLEYKSKPNEPVINESRWMGNISTNNMTIGGVGIIDNTAYTIERPVRHCRDISFDYELPPYHTQKLLDLIFDKINFDVYCNKTVFPLQYEFDNYCISNDGEYIIDSGSMKNVGNAFLYGKRNCVVEQVRTYYVYIPNTSIIDYSYESTYMDNSRCVPTKLHIVLKHGECERW